VVRNSLSAFFFLWEGVIRNYKRLLQKVSFETVFFGMSCLVSHNQESLSLGSSHSGSSTVEAPSWGLPILNVLLQGHLIGIVSWRVVSFGIFVSGKVFNEIVFSVTDLALVYKSLVERTMLLGNDP